MISDFNGSLKVQMNKPFHSYQKKFQDLILVVEGEHQKFFD
jgi:hypothetical protein